MSKKLIIIGLDCADPGLVFDRWKDQLPNLGHMIDNGISARMRSTDPPITVPAWTAMTTGKDPGTLGIYGFRNRLNHDYDSLAFADATRVTEPRIWDILGKMGKKSIVIGVPQTYPPKPLNGIMVSGFLTPSKAHPFVYPAAFREKLDQVAPDYMLDVDNFRTGDKETVIKQVYRMTAERFKLMNHCIRNEKWDFLMMVEIGPDRLQHAFWAYMDPESPFYQPGHRFANVIFEYYRYLDHEIGKISDLIDGETTLMIVSDHGAKAFHGGFCINEWLIGNGYLKVREYPAGPVPLAPENILWSETTAWGEGGYYARLNLNIAGREPEGIVTPTEADKLMEDLAQGLKKVSKGPVKIENQIHRPSDLYAQTNNIPPDLMLYPDNLNYRSIGGIGYNRLFTGGNDSGPDHANHDFYGIFIMHGPGIEPLSTDQISIYQVAPKVLEIFGS